MAVFSTPVQITFPNVFDAAPGTKLNVLSFDHTTGRLVINGTATVSADGKSVVSDEGSGVVAPGWHGMASPAEELDELDLQMAAMPGGFFSGNLPKLLLNFLGIGKAGVALSAPLLPATRIVTYYEAVTATADGIRTINELSAGDKRTKVEKIVDFLTKKIPVIGAILDVQENFKTIQDTILFV